MSLRPAKQQEPADQYEAAATDRPKWVRNSRLAEYFTVSAMCLWRWKRDPSLKCPPSYVVNGIEYNDLDAWDRWMRNRIISHLNRSRPGKGKAQSNAKT
ncbi:hypothetical protein ML401_20220 [Bradyrhizobium sp. 62B]|uniref:hypothetical protein n=1 Tax=Bradyrhizobium sp. 62B TaxID=2898442 RepID=UPI0025580E7C|nr:hypothetical protein ML401_20220 [Bradyrhizobium sp. 62B]